MEPRLIFAAVLLILLSAGCVGFRGIHGDGGSLLVSRIWVEPPRPVAGSEAFLFIEHKDTFVRPADGPGNWPGPPGVTTSAGTLSEVTGHEFLDLRMNHAGVDWIYNWQTPPTPQIVVIKAWYPDGGKSIKVEVVPES